MFVLPGFLIYDFAISIDICRKNIDYDCIDKYGQFLKSKGIHGVCVNSLTGEGTCLRMDERKRLAEEWLKVCRKYGLTMMLQICGIDIADIYLLAEHAEKIGVDCVCCLPDLCFKPKTEEDLVEYMKCIAKYCPTRPFYYCYLPKKTNVKCKWQIHLKFLLMITGFVQILNDKFLFNNLIQTVDMIRFYDMMERSMTTFCGIKYTCDKLEKACDLLKEGRNILMCGDKCFLGCCALGFDAFCLTAINIWPEMICEIYDCMLNCKFREARDIYWKMMRRIKEITLKEKCDYTDKMRLEFNKTYGWNFGTRKCMKNCKKLC